MSHYENLNNYSFWSKAIGTVEVSDVNPVVKINTKFKIGREEKVVSAGSCFAQRISSYLANNGFNYKIYESAHPILGEDTAKQYNYNIYSIYKRTSLPECQNALTPLIPLSHFIMKRYDLINFYFPGVNFSQ